MFETMLKNQTAEIKTNCRRKDIS